MSNPFSRILALLDLERVDDDRFVGLTPGDGPPRLFGGQVASQSLRAATLTVDGERLPHSLHAYFIRPGRPGVPLDLQVERTRDGRSFATRHVTASQEGEPIFTLTSSFHIEEPGEDWHRPQPIDVPGPDEVPRRESPFSRFQSMSPFEIRMINEPGASGFARPHPMWVRATGELPDDEVLHRCVLTYLSDMAVVGSARAPGSSLPLRFMGASLDHSVWFHRPIRTDQWLLFSVEPISNAGSRGLALGTMRTEDGVLLASITQEALLRDTRIVPLP